MHLIKELAENGKMTGIMFIHSIFVWTFPLLISISLYGQMKQDSAILTEKAPEIFKVRVRTTKGIFIMEACRSWSPQGVDRFYQLVKTGFYANNSIFRVQTGYVVQFGISDDKVVNEFWDKHPISDEAVKTRNFKGTISYARDGANTRTAQLFINLNDNFKLDTINYNGLRGFPQLQRSLMVLK